MHIDILLANTEIKTANVSCLEDLIAPLTKEEFYSKYFEQRPFLIKRNLPEYYSLYLKIQQVEEILTTRKLQKSDLRIVKQGLLKPVGEYLNSNDTVDTNKALDAFQNGSTLIFEHLDLQHKPIGQMLYCLEAETMLGLRSNVYLTPKNSSGFSTHWDSHDVFILQIEGEKLWNIYDAPIELPNTDQTKHQRKTLQQVSPNKIQEITLQPGDIFYMPRGFVHEPATNTTASLHVTIGIRQHTVEHMLTKSLEDICCNNAELRKVLQLEQELDQQHIKSILIDEINSYDFNKSKQSLFRRYIKSRVPKRGVELFRTSAEDITLSTRLRIVQPSVYQLFTRRNDIQLCFDGKSIRLPTVLKKTLEQVFQIQSFVPEELESLDDNSKLVLVRKLYSEGFLEIERGTTSKINIGTNEMVPL
ncbi:hypothetical protein CWC05_01265 [Pseudoalteromonas ruthenica]|uniref:JmjC domain-containing protein n=1 Tax=Pseudoalteromonas ruthenica TaxID=151081 RepID=A0A5S3Z9X8_9GAMM|nr:cupin domain-containing protein [Pseudoalteromonas ruthenica]TMP89013.1 hypothetical protein CWC05_01265 [Pseudoalteromonas ruthenica]